MKSTTTSEKIILNLLNSGVKLTREDKDMIREVVFDALAESYSYQSNGCDCGQPSCSICHG